MKGIDLKINNLNLIIQIVPLFLFLSLACKAQVTPVDSILIETLPNSDSLKPNSYLYVDFSFTNNNINSKDASAETSPASILDLSFYHKSGLWLGIVPTFYHKTVEPSYDLDFMLGYQLFLGKHFDINAYYSNHTYNGDSINKGIDYNHTGSISIGLDFNWIYIFTEAYSFHGTSDNYNNEIGLSLYHAFENVFRKNDNISLMPITTISFGTDYWIQDDFTTRQTIRYVNYLLRNGYSTNHYGYQGFDIILPITYQINNFSASVSYSYNVPANKFKGFGWSNQSGIMFSINYLINFK